MHCGKERTSRLWKTDLIAPLWCSTLVHTLHFITITIPVICKLRLKIILLPNVCVIVKWLRSVGKGYLLHKRKLLL